MSEKFTSEQLKAIEYREGRSAVVSASAGSGKTSVLVEHIASLISDEKNPVSADRLAVVTFTEKAAAELRERLDKRIGRLLEEDSESEFLREQLVRLSSARISTISSFCLSLIRDNIRLLPLDEGFAVGEETKTAMLSQNAVKKMLRRLYTEASADKKAEIARRLGGEKNISAAVLKLYGFLSNIPSREDWVKEQLQVFSSPEGYSELYTKKARQAAIDAFNEVDGLRAEADMLLDAPQPDENAEKAAKKLRGYFELLFGQTCEIKAALEAGDDKGLLAALKNGAGRYPSIKNMPEFDRLKAVRDKVKGCIDICASYAQAIPCAERDAYDCGRTLELLWELEKIYSQEYSALKAKENIVDFSDLERYALEAARKGGGKGLFDYIIVDEFQDSNDVQYEIFRLLSDGEKNLYLVGDVKQCIYSFRSANPEIFASLLHNGKYETILLNKNFRSCDNVIETVNMLFGKGNKLPKSFCGGQWEDMTAGRGIAPCAENKSELVILNYQEEDTKEADYVAGRIKQMVEEGFAVHGRNGRRPCGYGDFAVLLRTGGKMMNYRRAFDKAGIPFTCAGEKAFTDLTEVELAMSVLGAVLRPNDDFAALNAMMSPVYGFTAEDMAMVRLAEGTNVQSPERRSLYRNLEDIAALESTAPAALKSKCRKFDSDMKLFRKTAANTVSEELLREIYRVTALPELMSVGYKGRERRENLNLLLYYARSSPRPADFAALMRSIKRSRLEMPQAQLKEQEEGSVKIMTVHKSKGLQFPVVFLSDTNGKPESRDLYEPFIFDREGGAGILVCDYGKPVRCVTASHRLMSDRLADKVNGEEARLLYVAMTRAEEKLIITAGCHIKADKEGNADESRPPAAYKGNYLDFLLQRLEQAPDALSLIRIASDKEIQLQRVQEAAPQKTALPDFAQVRKRICYQYPFQNAVRTPAKFTATALGVEAGEGADEASVTGAFYMGLPLFMKKDRPLTPKERGDVYHKVMENLDFSAKSAEEELERLYADGTVTLGEKNAVDPAELQSFLDSDIAERAVRSGSLHREFKLFTTVNRTGEPVTDRDDLSFVQGVADMFFIENGRIVLVDYKTNRNTTEEKLIEEYKGQLEIYKKALEEMLGAEVAECWLFSFWLKKAVLAVYS